MLKSRILTALILLPFVIAAIVFLTPFQFALVSALVVLLATHEWLKLMDINKPYQQALYHLFIQFCLGLSLFVSLKAVLAISIFWWGLAFVWVVCYPKFQQVWSNKLILAILGLEVLAPFWLAVNHLRTSLSPETLLFLLVLVWLADSGAYFAGKLFGRHKLCEQVSPAKTIEGVLGGAVCAMLFAGGALFWYPMPPKQILPWSCMILATVLISVLGDLLESMVKRHHGVKESGGLLPGHGGVLDRIDSLTAAAPFFLLGMLLMQLPPLNIWSFQNQIIGMFSAF